MNILILNDKIAQSNKYMEELPNKCSYYKREESLFETLLKFLDYCKQLVLSEHKN
jgi:hypothetical protein